MKVISHGNCLESSAPVDIVARELTATRKAMQDMAMLLRSMGEEISDLRRQVRLLEKVTPSQASAINRAIRERAALLCQDYRAPGGEKAVGAAIRKAIRVTFGASTVRELPRCDFEVALDQVRIWDDYKAMMAIRRKNNGKVQD